MAKSIERIVTIHTESEFTPVTEMVMERVFEDVEIPVPGKVGTFTIQRTYKTVKKEVPKRDENGNAIVTVREIDVVRVRDRMSDGKLNIDTYYPHEKEILVEDIGQQIADDVVSNTKWE